jgi:hypothetical protein
LKFSKFMREQLRDRIRSLPKKKGIGSAPRTGSMPALSSADRLVSRGKRQQSNVARLLDGPGKPPLVRSAHAGQPPGDDFAALGHEPLQQPYVAIRNRVNLFGAELANLLAPEKLAAASGAAARAWTART